MSSEEYGVDDVEENGLELGRTFVANSNLLSTRDALGNHSQKEWFSYEIVRSVLEGLTIGLEFTSPVVQLLFQAIRCSTAPKQDATKDLAASDQERRRIDAAMAALEALAGTSRTPYALQEHDCGTPYFSCSATPTSYSQEVVVGFESAASVSEGLSSLLSSACLRVPSFGSVLVDVVSSDARLQTAVMNVAVSQSSPRMRELCVPLRRRARGHRDWANTRADLLILMTSTGTSERVVAAAIPKFLSNAELARYESDVMQRLRSTVRLNGTALRPGTVLLLRIRQGTLAQDKGDEFLKVKRQAGTGWPFHAELGTDGVSVLFRCAAGEHQSHDGHTILRARSVVTMAGMDGAGALARVNKELGKKSVKEMEVRLRAPPAGVGGNAQGPRGPTTNEDRWSLVDISALVAGTHANGNVDLIAHCRKENDKDKIYLQNVPRDQVSVRALPADGLGVSAAVDPEAALAAYTDRDESGAHPWGVVGNGSNHYRVVWMGDGSDQQKSREHGHLNSVTVGFAGASKGMRVIGGSHLQFWPVGLWYGRDSREALELHAKPIFEEWGRLKKKLDVAKTRDGAGPTFEVAAAMVDGKYIWECSGSGRGLSVCDDPTNNMPRVLQQICNSITGRQTHFPFMNLTEARHARILSSGNKKEMKYKNVESEYTLPGLEK